MKCSCSTFYAIAIFFFCPYFFLKLNRMLLSWLNCSSRSSHWVHREFPGIHLGQSESFKPIELPLSNSKKHAHHPHHRFACDASNKQFRAITGGCASPADLLTHLSCLCRDDISIIATIYKPVNWMHFECCQCLSIKSTRKWHFCARKEKWAVLSFTRFGYRSLLLFARCSPIVCLKQCCFLFSVFT